MAPYGIQVRGKERRIDSSRYDVVRDFDKLKVNYEHNDLDLSTVPAGFRAPSENLDTAALLLRADSDDFDRETLLECFERDLLAVIGALPYSTESTICSKYSDLLKVNPRKVLQKLRYPSLEEFLLSNEMRGKVQVRIEEDGARRFHTYPTARNHHLIESIMITEQALAEQQHMNVETNEARLMAMRSNRTVLENRLIIVRMLADLGCENKGVPTLKFQEYYESKTRRPLNGKEWGRMFKKGRMISALENFFYNDVYIDVVKKKGMHIKLRRPLREIEKEIFEKLDADGHAPLDERERKDYHNRQVKGGDAPNPITILRSLNPVATHGKPKRAMTLQDKIDTARKNMTLPSPQTDENDDMYENIPLSLPELNRARKRMPQTIYNPRPVLMRNEENQEYNPKPRGLRPAQEGYELEKEYNNMDDDEIAKYKEALLKKRSELRRKPLGGRS
ncbi:hypothetical protein QR680_012576 [Steinernema hermaphroditum]|uniref:DUF7516 domain-containing protein n=1 Tax=Steinernema hermaphroditum TaxID=289476 RepID=A0AA39I2F6_9BILA|nr:hypothetical protein QR680_012576 [Steinernema hermaphroditum]